LSLPRNGEKEGKTTQKELEEIGFHSQLIDGYNGHHICFSICLL